MNHHSVSLSIDIVSSISGDPIALGFLSLPYIYFPYALVSFSPTAMRHSSFRYLQRGRREVDARRSWRFRTLDVDDVHLRIRVTCRSACPPFSSTSFVRAASLVSANNDRMRDRIDRDTSRDYDDYEMAAFKGHIIYFNGKIYR